jgi:hypothetical protein
MKMANSLVYAAAEFAGKNAQSPHSAKSIQCTVRLLHGGCWNSLNLDSLSCSRTNRRTRSIPFWSHACPVLQPVVQPMRLTLKMWGAQVPS